MGQMTLGECKNAILKLINQYSIAGGTVALSYNNQADYVARIIPLINDAQMEIAKTVRKIPAQFVINQTAIPNLCTETGTVLHGNTDRVIGESRQPARSYYFEVNGPAEIYIEEKRKSEWLIVREFSVTEQPETFTAFRGMAGTGEGPLRFRLSGRFPYLFKNGAFYEYTFASEEKVPVFGEYFEYELPEDYYQLNGRGIPHYRSGGEFVMSHQFHWRGDRTLLLDRELSGDFFVDYFRYPKRFAEDAADSMVLDNAPDTHEAVPYLVASMLCSHDNPSLSATLYNIFETRLSRMNEATFSENLDIQDVYGMNVGMGWC